MTIDLNADQTTNAINPADADDVVVLGLLPEPSHTRSPGVAHHDRDSSLRVRPAPVDALPTHETPCKPVPVRELATRPALSPTSTAVAANNLTAERLESLLSTGAARPTSLLLAVGFGLAGTLLIRWASSHVGTDNTVVLVATAAGAACGLLLIVAALIGKAER